MKHAFKLKHLSLALVTAFAYTPLAFSADAGNEQQLSEISVKGEKPAIPANLPNTVESVTAQKIEETVNSVTTAGVLQYLPSIHVRERYVGDVNGILVMRVNSSTSSAQTTVYADGLLISNFLNNSFSTAPRWGVVSPDEIDRVDVMYGPYSALYPGNSAGGVVNISTHMPTKFEAHVRADYFTQNFKEYGTDDTFSGWHTSASLGNKVGDWSFWADFDHMDNHGHPMTYTAAAKKSGLAAGAGTYTVVTGALSDIDTSGNPRVITSAASIDHTVQDNGKIKLAYDFSPTVRATYTLGIWDNTSNKTGQTYLTDGAGNLIYGTKTATSPYQYLRINGLDYTVAAPSTSRQEATSYLHGLSLKTSTDGMWDWEVIASLYDASKDATRTSSGNYGITPSTAAIAGTYADASGTGWWNIDLRGDFRPEGSLKSIHQLSFGAHIDRYTLESDTYNLLPGNFYTSGIGALSSNARGNTQTEALYLQDAWKLAPNLKLVYGGRAERWQAFDGSNVSGATTYNYADRTENTFSPKAALTWVANADWVVNASVGKGVRFPTVGELFNNKTIKNGSITLTAADLAGFPAPYNTITNDPTLKPEKVVSSELSFQRALGSGMVRLSLFNENKTDALISQTDTTTLPVLLGPGHDNYTISSIQNVDEVQTSGVELAFNLTNVWINGLDIYGSMTYTDSIIEKNSENPGLEGTDQPRIPHKRATLVATYHANDQLSFSLAGRYSGHQHNSLYDAVNHKYTDVNPDVYGAVSQYKVMDAKVLYKLDKQWSASLGINNIGSYKYYVNPNPYPQRTYYVGVKFDY
ncbi:MAG: TonB-dependent receptor [Thiobacillaceae bacterium]